MISIASFLRGVYRVPGARDAFDYVAVHPYARTPSGVVDLVEHTRSVMNAAGDRDKKIWVTEFGWATGGGHPDFSVSFARQALYLRQTYGALIGRRAASGCAERCGTCSATRPTTATRSAAGRPALACAPPPERPSPPGAPWSTSPAQGR